MRRLLAPHCLNEGVDNPHAELVPPMLIHERGPVQNHSATISSGEWNKTATWRARTGRLLLEVNVHHGCVEAEYSEMRQGRYTTQPPADSHRLLYRCACRRKRVMVPHHPNEKAVGDRDGEGAARGSSRHQMVASQNGEFALGKNLGPRHGHSVKRPAPPAAHPDRSVEIELAIARCAELMQFGRHRPILSRIAALSANLHELRTGGREWVRVAGERGTDTGRAEAGRGAAAGRVT